MRLGGPSAGSGGWAGKADFQSRLTWSITKTTRVRCCGYYLNECSLVVPGDIRDKKKMFAGEEKCATVQQRNLLRYHFTAAVLERLVVGGGGGNENSVYAQVEDMTGSIPILVAGDGRQLSSAFGALCFSAPAASLSVGLLQASLFLLRLKRAPGAFGPLPPSAGCEARLLLRWLEGERKIELEGLPPTSAPSDRWFTHDPAWPGEVVGASLLGPSVLRSRAEISARSRRFVRSSSCNRRCCCLLSLLSIVLG